MTPSILRLLIWIRKKNPQKPVNRKKWKHEAKHIWRIWITTLMPKNVLTWHTKILVVSQYLKIPQIKNEECSPIYYYFWLVLRPTAEIPDYRGAISRDSCFILLLFSVAPSWIPDREDCGSGAVVGGNLWLTVGVALLTLPTITMWAWTHWGVVRDWIQHLIW